MKSMPINLTASLIEKTVFSCTVLILGSLMQGIVAQSAAAQQLPPLPIEFNPDNLINPGRPGGRRRGGGSRGSCQAGLPLSAISYADSRTVQELGVSSVEETVGMLTTQAQPTLWFYLPAAVDDVSTEFIVKGAQEQIVYQGRLSGQTDSEGVISVLLPVNLAVGSAYRWFLTVDCDDTERVSVDGWVARRTTGPDATRTLAQASARNRVALYANYGFLQDAVSELGVLRAGEEGAIEQEWNQLLISLELPELVNARVFSCCEVVNAPEEVSQPEVEEIPEVTEPEEEEEPEETLERETRSILERARDRGN